MKRLTVLTLCWALLGLGLGCGGSNQNSGGPSGGGGGEASELSGSGSTFIRPMMEKWAELYKQQKNVAINYQGKGSTAGINDMIDKTTDFGCTDAPMAREQLQKAEASGGPVLHIPLVMGGVVPAYNLHGLGDKPIRFTGEVLAEIFMGKISKWNDKKLQSLQEPGVTLPNQGISIVHRSDGSGTTFIFTDYLSNVSPEWKQNIGANTAVNWPENSDGEPGNPGVANFIKKTPGAIGYVELIYALQEKIPYGIVKNKDGKWVRATLKSVSAAADGALKTIPEDLRYSITNAPGPDAYPISGTTWAVLYQKQSADHGKAVEDFLTWATHDGQKDTEQLYYASLPPGLVKRVDAKLASIQIAPR